MADGYPLADCGREELTHKRIDRVIKLQLSIAHQRQDRKCGELLGERGPIEYGLPRYGYAVFHVSEAECARIKDFAPSYDGSSYAGTVGGISLAHQAISSIVRTSRKNQGA